MLINNLNSAILSIKLGFKYYVKHFQQFPNIPGEYSCRASNPQGTVISSANLKVEDRCQVDSSSFLDTDTLNRLTNRLIRI